MISANLLKLGMLSVAALLFTACETTVVHEKSDHPQVGPPAHAPAHGYRAKHAYRYYPASNVYYESASSNWWYIDSGDWKIGASLPKGIVVKGDYITIETDTDRPYIENESHRSRAPGLSQSKTKAKSKTKSKGSLKGQGKGQVK